MDVQKYYLICVNFRMGTDPFSFFKEQSLIFKFYKLRARSNSAKRSHCFKVCIAWHISAKIAQLLI